MSQVIPESSSPVSSKLYVHVKLQMIRNKNKPQVSQRKFKSQVIWHKIKYHNNG